jgi:hypothetical protein
MVVNSVSLYVEHKNRMFLLIYAVFVYFLDTFVACKLTNFGDARNLSSVRHWLSDDIEGAFEHRVRAYDIWHDHPNRVKKYNLWSIYAQKRKFLERIIRDLLR